MIALGIFGLIRGAASRHWTKVSGRVSKVAIECHTRYGAKDKYAARVDYEYVVDGRLRRDSLGFPSNGHRASAAREACDYSDGQRIDVFFDPLRPDRNTLKPGLDYAWLTPVIMGCVFVGVSVALFRSAMK